MLKNYVYVALRNLKRNRLYVGLNLLGLIIAFATLALIFLYVDHESSFEDFHQNRDRIFRITHHFQSNTDFEVHWARVPVNFINHIPEEIPEVEHLVRFQNQERKYVRIGQNKFRPEHVYVTDPEVFEVFDFPLVSGNPNLALIAPYSVVLSESLANAYFGRTDVVGQQLHLSSDFNSSENTYIVQGVMADLPTRTHLPVDMLLSFRNAEERSGWAYVYALLKEGTPSEVLEEKLPPFVSHHTQGDSSGTIHFIPQRIESIHLHSDLAREIVPNGSAFYVKAFFITGILILLIALFNYVNLNNSLVLGRAKEIGMRKLMGADSRQLLVYGLVESFTYSFIAVCIGMGLAFGLFPYFQSLTGGTISPNWGEIGGIMLGVAILCGVGIGLYPAFVLPTFHPVHILKWNKSFQLTGSTKASRWKRLMVGVQFGISIVLVACTLIAGSQIRFLEKKKLGLDEEHVLALPAVPSQVRESYESFRNRLEASPLVKQVAACMEVPSREIRDTGPVLVLGKNEDLNQAPMLDAQVISPNFVELMGMELIAGENRNTRFDMKAIPEFTEEFGPQAYLREKGRTYLINEMAVQKLGFETAEEAIGQQINWSIGGFRLAYGPITGVVKNFHQETLKNRIDPIVLFVEPLWLSTFLIKLESNGLEAGVDQIQGIWDEMFPTYPFSFVFLDELYEGLYKRERVQLALLRNLSALAIFLSFMGLFALISYSLKTRTQEIAIRKILGARLGHLIQDIGKEYIGIWILSGLIALPVSYYIIQRGLEGFAYRVPDTAIPYFLTMFIIFVLLGLTLTFQAARSSSMDPAKVLKDE
ncbi:MAG: FtsX-like permease family protein [Bacteroidota bacterium]